MVFISPGVSVAAAGIVSGLFFIIINKLRQARSTDAEKDAEAKPVLDSSRCACCLKPFVVGRGVECGECGARACRKGCSRWDTPENAWYCLFCHQRRLWLRRNEKWFETFGGLSADHDAAAHRFSTAKSQVFLGGSTPSSRKASASEKAANSVVVEESPGDEKRADYVGVGPGAGLAAGGEENAESSVERVREFVEKIVDNLVGDVDEMPIDRIYDHQAYDELLENYREPLAGALARLAVSLQLSITHKPATDTPTMAHAALRDLVERAVEEARKLPGLGSSDAGKSAEPKDISEQTYEDLLATAILNKVIEKYQNERVDDNSNKLQDSRTSPRQKYITSEIEVGLDEGVEEGSSSLEPLSQDEYSSDCSAPAPKYTITRQEPLSLTIEEHIEEVTTTYTSEEEEDQDDAEANGLDFRNAHRVPFPEFGMDIIDPSQESSEETQDEAVTPTHVDLITPVESWEENWLFQKKKMQAQSEPVSMLVPNPSEDFKPLIGDREADDTSDLSDCSAQSDDEIEQELLEAINNVVLRPEVNETSPSLKVEGIIENETKITSNVTKIEDSNESTELWKTTISIGEDNSVKNTLIDLQAKEVGVNEFKSVEQNGKDDCGIKLGIEDMLVFHLKDKRTSQYEQEIKHQDHSIEFIEKEKSSANLVSRDIKPDDAVVMIPGRTTQVESKAMVISDVEKAVDSLQVENGHTSLQLKNDLQPFNGETNKNLENDVTMLQATRYKTNENVEKDLELPEDRINENLEKDNSTQQLKRDFKLPVEETNQNIEKSLEVKRDFETSIRESELLKVDNNLQGRSYDVKPVLETVTRPALLEDSAVKEDLSVISRDTDQFLNLDDDLEVKEVPGTPTSSPLRLETSALETGIQIDLQSLDEKLVSIESRAATKRSSLNETFNSYVQKSGEASATFDSISNNLKEVKDGVVEARVIFVGNGDEHSHVLKTEFHGTDAQNEDGAQQESEYTEHYATATQRHLDSLTRPSKTIDIDEAVKLVDHLHHDDIPPPIPSTPPPIARLKQCRKAAALAKAEVEVDVSQPQTAERKRVEVDLFLAAPPRPGTIAEREHKKWENAAPIENNPYSEENIQKRLWQRQYTRKHSSDASVVENSKPPNMAGVPLQVVLGAGQPDVKRYGRDYYINDAKRASGERARRSAMLNAEGRNSSLSQNSGSYDDDLEPQDEIQYQGTEQISNTGVTEVRTKVATWQQNNIDSNYNVVTRGRQRVETTIHLGVTPDTVDGNDAKIKSIESSILEVDNSWGAQNAEDLLENVRRNSKNELNAKLNNQEDAERITASETRKSFVNDSQKSIKRIDLKAYGFANEINSNGSSVTKVTGKRVVNKLDLKSFGYDSELKRIQSTGQIDAKLNNEIDAKPRIVKMKTKSNLTEHHVGYERSKSTHNLVEYVEASGDFDKTKSTEILNEDKILSESLNDFGGMMSAKSMPNVTKIEHYSQNFSPIGRYKDEEDLIASHLSTQRQKFKEEEILRQEMIRASAKSQGLWKSETLIFTGEKTSANNFSSEDELEDIIRNTRSTEILTKKEIFENTNDLNTSSTNDIAENLPMPSVRRLAQSFIKIPTEKPSAPPRMLKTNGNARKDRPTTPEIHIIETPRQMHSLTARSISREFREGLRQIPTKVTSTTTTASTIISEQSTVVKNQLEVVKSEIDSSSDDVAVIAPGKLKNNIKFWEQLQKQS